MALLQREDVPAKQTGTARRGAYECQHEQWIDHGNVDGIHRRNALFLCRQPAERRHHEGGEQVKKMPATQAAAERRPTKLAAMKPS